MSEFTNFLYVRAKAVMQGEKEARQLVKDVLAEGLEQKEAYEQVYRKGSQRFINKLNRESKELELWEEDAAVTTEASEEVLEEIGDVFGIMPDLFFATAFACCYDGMTVKKAANVMGCSEGNVRYRLNYVKKCVQDAMGDGAFSVQSLCKAIDTWMLRYIEEAENAAPTEWSSLVVPMPKKARKQLEKKELEAAAEVVEEDPIEEVVEEVAEEAPVEEPVAEETVEEVSVEESVAEEVVEEVPVEEAEPEAEEVVEEVSVEEPVAEVVVEEEPEEEPTAEVEAIAEETVEEEAEEAAEKVVEEEEAPRKKSAGKVISLIAIILVLLGAGYYLVHQHVEFPVDKQAKKEESQELETPQTPSMPQQQEEPVVDTPVVEEPIVDTPVIEKPEEKKESEYILADSDKKLISKEKLRKMTKKELRFARNEIYARYGVKFDEEQLDNYFGSKSWYKPKMTLTKFYDTLELNEIEEENVARISEVEREK